ncbi:hypothetical protein J2T20_002360 [Paenibacillus wynnii]|nr:hypothetical protein [Paenibacillus wynnii]
MAETIIEVGNDLERMNQSSESMNSCMLPEKWPRVWKT